MNSYASPCPRAEQVWEYCNAVASDGPFKRLTKADAVKLVQWLDVNYAGWDNAGDGTPLNAWHAADCCRVAWECIPYVLPEKVKARSRLDRVGALEELADLREFHHAMNNDSYKKMNLGNLNARRAEVYVNYPRATGGWRGVLYGALAGAVICVCAVLWIVVAAPKGEVSLPGQSAQKMVRPSQTPAAKRKQTAKDVIADQAGSLGIVTYESFQESQIGAGQALVVRFDLQEVGGKRSKNIWTFSFDGRSGEVFNLLKVQE